MTASAAAPTLLPTPVSGRITVLIVDDEPPARRGLRALLEEQADIEIVGEARNGREAIEAITTLQPALVFLDVQMPEGDGFDVIRAIGVEKMPVVVFATAFDQYALSAFEAHALDYLLKPYDRARFDAALDRARTQLRRQTVDDRLLAFVDRIENRARYLSRFTVRNGTRTQFIPASSVDYLEAESNYVRLRVGDHSYLIRDTLTALGERLDPAQFLRVHRSLIVQTSRIVEIESLFAGEYVLFLSTGRRLTTGRTYRAAVQAALGI
jgi:two-component system, LytTR family, response regulator